MADDKTRVMIVNTSAAVRQFIARALASAGDVDVIGTAADPVIALEKMRSKWPDVIIIDQQMPRIDAAVFVRRIMSRRPTPVIVCAAPGEMHAAGYGEAVTLIARPQPGLQGTLEGDPDEIVHAVRRAARMPVRAPGKRNEATPPPAKLSADVIIAANTPALPAYGDERIVAIGTSTGGTQALEVILTRLPDDCRGIVIVQHMPAVFTAMFAERLHNISQIEVREARSGDRVAPGLALIAPGGKHMLVKRQGSHYVVEVIDGPLVNRHRPSVDVLFRSVARYAGANALGIIMTGMGDDGARGLKEMRDAGARTIAQDEASCVVFGMPNEAIKLGAVDLTLPLDEIAPAITSYSKGNP